MLCTSFHKLVYKCYSTVKVNSILFVFQCYMASGLITPVANNGDLDIGTWILLEKVTIFSGV